LERKTVDSRDCGFGKILPVRSPVEAFTKGSSSFEGGVGLLVIMPKTHDFKGKNLHSVALRGQGTDSLLSLASLFWLLGCSAYYSKE
jgi:hypothetical protein